MKKHNSIEGTTRVVAPVSNVRLLSISQNNNTFDDTGDPAEHNRTNLISDKTSLTILSDTALNSDGTTVSYSGVTTFQNIPLYSDCSKILHNRSHHYISTSGWQPLYSILKDDQYNIIDYDSWDNDVDYDDEAKYIDISVLTSEIDTFTMYCYQPPCLEVSADIVNSKPSGSAVIFRCGTSTKFYAKSIGVENGDTLRFQLSPNYYAYNNSYYIDGYSLPLDAGTYVLQYLYPQRIETNETITLKLISGSATNYMSEYVENTITSEITDNEAHTLEFTLEHDSDIYIALTSTLSTKTFLYLSDVVIYDKAAGYNDTHDEVISKPLANFSPSHFRRFDNTADSLIRKGNTVLSKIIWKRATLNMENTSYETVSSNTKTKLIRISLDGSNIKPNTKIHSPYFLRREELDNAREYEYLYNDNNYLYLNIYLDRTDEEVSFVIYYQLQNPQYNKENSPYFYKIFDPVYLSPYLSQQETDLFIDTRFMIVKEDNE